MTTRKRLFTIILSISFMIIILCSALGSNIAVYAENTADIFFMSFYNDITDTYIISNTRLLLPTDKITVIETPEVLMNSGVVASFTTLDGTINGITVGNEVYEADKVGEKGYFYAKLNGEKLDSAGNQTNIKKGDIVEWVFANEAIDESNTSSDSKTSSTVIVKKKSQFWNDSTSKSLNSACDWLNRNREESNLYLTAFGIASKTANTKQVNDLLNAISQNPEYATSTEIANKILAASFCGFDASAVKYGQLVTKLSTYPEISKQGVYGCAYSLIAYDSNQYDISSISVNSRKSLVDSLLKFQNEDGGFAGTLNTQSNNEATSVAVIALSNYRERSDVKTAIEKAVLYMEDKKSLYISTSDGASRLICALNSVDIEVGDTRFVIDNLNLMENLLLFQNNDGGFGNIVGEESNVTSTEQAIIALGSIKKSGNPYRLTTLVEKYKEIEVTENKQVGSKNYAAVIIAIIGGVIIIGIVVTIICARVIKKEK